MHRRTRIGHGEAHHSEIQKHSWDTRSIFLFLPDMLPQFAF